MHVRRTGFKGHRWKLHTKSMMAPRMLAKVASPWAPHDLTNIEISKHTNNPYQDQRCKMMPLPTLRQGHSGLRTLSFGAVLWSVQCYCCISCKFETAESHQTMASHHGHACVEQGFNIHPGHALNPECVTRL